MMDIAIRPARDADAPSMKDLWKEVFGDPDELIDAFFELFFRPGRAAAACLGEEIVSAGYVVPSGDLIFPDGAGVKSAMLYAIATRPAARGRGTGAALTQFLARLGYGAGYRAITLHPADERLFGFYKRRAGFEDFFASNEAVIRGEDLETPDSWLEPISPPDYTVFRERFLRDRAHLSLSGSAAEYQARLCETCGGGFFTFRGGLDGCAIVERGVENVYVKELLLPDYALVPRAASAVASAFGAEEYRLRFPRDTGGGIAGAARHFAMILMEDGILPRGGEEAWYGPAFD